MGGPVVSADGTLCGVQDFMAGGGKGGLWKAQRVPAEPWHMGQYGYNQVTPLRSCPPVTCNCAYHCIASTLTGSLSLLGYHRCKTNRHNLARLPIHPIVREVAADC